MKLHLIRHGQTVTSGRTFAGRRDVALTVLGRAEAEAVARQLAARPIALVLTSPLSRTVDTARPLAERLGLAAIADPALLEFDFGDYEGRGKPALGLSLRKAHARDPVPGGESLFDVWNRAGEVLARRATPDLSGAEIAVVGHFWINRMLYGRARGLDFETACRTREYRPGTGSVTTVEVALSGLVAARESRGAERDAGPRAPPVGQKRP